MRTSTPDAALHDLDDVAAAPRPRKHQLLWVYATVFVLNLCPMPMLFAWDFAREGRVGLMLAVLVLFAAGLAACASVRAVGVLLVSGGVVVGVSQIFPIIHIFAGMFVLDLAKGSGLTESAAWGGLDVIATGNRGAFVVILTMGAMLMLAALAVGIPAWSVFRPRR